MRTDDGASYGVDAGVALEVQSTNSESAVVASAKDVGYGQVGGKWAMLVGVCLFTCLL